MGPTLPPNPSVGHHLRLCLSSGNFSMCCHSQWCCHSHFECMRHNQSFLVISGILRSVTILLYSALLFFFHSWLQKAKRYFLCALLVGTWAMTIYTATLPSVKNLQCQFRRSLKKIIISCFLTSYFLLKIIWKAIINQCQPHDYIKYLIRDAQDRD